jgi:hypothetical protein
MKRMEPFTTDRTALRAELAAFEKLLSPPTRELSERDDILPFMKANRNLAALIAMKYSQLSVPNLFKSEREIFGDFACDLALGDHDNGQFCFIEFEDATADSVFRQGTRGIPDWSPRLEHGLSQIVDWFYLLDDHRHTQQFRTFFTTDLAHYTGLLVIGRDGFLTDPLRHRLRWRSQHTALNGKAVQIVTFDALLQTLRVNVDLFAQPVPSPPAMPKAPKKKPKK